MEKRYEKQLVVDSVECRGHIQKHESAYVALINACDEIVVDFN